MKNQEDYNGWKNRSTWNVALWINNDYNLYNSAIEYVKEHKISKRTGKPTTKLYSNFIRYVGLANDKTPDNIKYISTLLDYDALNEMMRELV